MPDFKAINDSLLPGEFKPKNRLLESQTLDKTIETWNVTLTEIYKIYKDINTSDTDATGLTFTTIMNSLNTLRKDGILGKTDLRAMREVQEKYIQMSLILAYDDDLPLASIGLLEPILYELLKLLEQRRLKASLSASFFEEDRVISASFEVLLAWVYILITQKKWRRAWFLSNYGLGKFDPTHEQLIKWHLLAVFNCCEVEEYEKQYAKYKPFISGDFNPKLVIETEEPLSVEPLILSVPFRTWNSLLASLVDHIITLRDDKRLPVTWGSKIMGIEFSSSEPQSQPSQPQAPSLKSHLSAVAFTFNGGSHAENHINTAEDSEIESSQTTANRKRKASTIAKKNLKRHRKSLPNANKSASTPFGIELVDYFKKYNFINSEVELLVQKYFNMLQVPILPIESIDIDNLFIHGEQVFLIDFVKWVIANVPPRAQKLNEFFGLVKIIFDSDLQFLIFHECPLLVGELAKSFYELNIRENMDKLIELLKKPEYLTLQSYPMPIEDPEASYHKVKSSIGRSEADKKVYSFDYVLANLDPLKLEIYLSSFLCSMDGISQNELIAFLIVLAERQYIENLPVQVSALKRLFALLVEKFLDLDESIYELALRVQSSAIDEGLVKTMIRKMEKPSAYQWELIRSLFKLNKITTDNNNSIEPLNTVSPGDSIPLDKEIGKYIINYLEDRWQCLECNIDEPAILDAIELLVEFIKPLPIEQMLIQANLGILKKFLKTLSKDMLVIQKKALLNLYKIENHSEDLQLVKRALILRVEMCEDSFSNRKRNIDWLKSFQRDIKLLIAIGGNSSFGDLFEKLGLLNWEIANQLLLHTEPMLLRSKINQIRRSLKKTWLMLYQTDRNHSGLLIHVLFLLLHSVVQITNRNIVGFEEEDVTETLKNQALARMVQLVEDSTDSKSFLLIGWVLLEHDKYKKLASIYFLKCLKLEIAKGPNDANLDLLYLLVYFIKTFFLVELFQKRLEHLYRQLEQQQLSQDQTTESLMEMGSEDLVNRLLEILARDTFNLHLSAEHHFPFFQKPKAQTFSSLSVPLIIPGILNYFIDKVTSEFLSLDNDVEELILVLNRLRNLESQLVFPTKHIIDCCGKLELLVTEENKGMIIREMTYNKQIPQVQTILTRIKGTK